MRVGCRVRVRDSLFGVVAFLGEVEFAEGLWAGIDLETPDGKHNGTVGDKAYFEARGPRNGIFVRAHLALPWKLRKRKGASPASRGFSASAPVETSVDGGLGLANSPSPLRSSESSEAQGGRRSPLVESSPTVLLGRLAGDSGGASPRSFAGTDDDDNDSVCSTATTETAWSVPQSEWVGVYDTTRAATPPLISPNTRRADFARLVVTLPPAAAEGNGSGMGPLLAPPNAATAFDGYDQMSSASPPISPLEEGTFSYDTSPTGYGSIGHSTDATPLPGLAPRDGSGADGSVSPSTDLAKALSEDGSRWNEAFQQLMELPVATPEQGKAKSRSLSNLARRFEGKCF